MTNDSTKKALQAQLVAQWITSLAISVVCCAVLFIVFAGYIVDLHEVTNLQTVKLELLLERHNQIQNEIAYLKRTPMVQINGVNGTPTVQSVPQQPVEAPAAPAVVPPSTSPDGLHLNEAEPTVADPAEPSSAESSPLPEKIKAPAPALKIR